MLDQKVVDWFRPDDKAVTLLSCDRRYDQGLCNTKKAIEITTGESASNPRPGYLTAERDGLVFVTWYDKPARATKREWPYPYARYNVRFILYPDAVTFAILEAGE